MVKSAAVTVDDYLRELPEERREVISRVRELVIANLPEGYREQISFGMIGYGIPLERYPDTYNGQPLGYIAIAAQKNGYSLYLNGAYMDPKLTAEIRDGFASAGKKLDMGKSCIRFRRIDDLPLDVIARAVARLTPEEFITMYERSRM